MPRDIVKTARQHHRGQSLVEYLLVVALIALAAIAGMSTAAQTINNAFNTVGNKLYNAVGT